MARRREQYAWWDETHNPWIGCTKVSSACRNCYAAEQAERFWQGTWGSKADRVILGDTNAAKPFVWQRRAERTGTTVRVFCGSMCDVFEDNPKVVNARKQLWQTIAATPDLIWMLTTKRPENVPHLVPGAWMHDWPHNAWVIATVEEQRMAEQRMPHLCAIPAPVLGVSVEPARERVDLTPWLDQVGWVITGGESGRKAKPSDPDWFRALRDDCARHGVPFFFKQWGLFDAEGRRLGKGKSGDVLDGAQHHNWPTAVRKDSAYANAA